MAARLLFIKKHVYRDFLIFIEAFGELLLWTAIDCSNKEPYQGHIILKFDNKEQKKKLGDNHSEKTLAAATSMLLHQAMATVDTLLDGSEIKTDEQKLGLDVVNAIESLGNEKPKQETTSN